MRPFRNLRRGRLRNQYIGDWKFLGFQPGEVDDLTRVLDIDPHDLSGHVVVHDHSGRHFIRIGTRALGY